MTIPQSGPSPHVDPSLASKGEGPPSSQHTARVNEILNGAAPKFPDAYKTKPLPPSPKSSVKSEDAVTTKPQEKIPTRNFKEKMSSALGETVKELKALKGAIKSTFHQAFHTGLKTLGKDKSEEKDTSPLGASHDYNTFSEGRDLTPRGVPETKRRALYVDDLFTTSSSTSVAPENPSSSTADLPEVKKENIPSEPFVPSPNGSAAKLLSKLDKSSYEMRSVSSELSEKDCTTLAENLLGDKDYIFIIQKGSAEVDTKVLVFFNKSRPLLGKGVELGDALSKDVNHGFVSPYVLPFAITPHVEETATKLNSNLEIKEESTTTEHQTPTSSTLAQRSIKRLTDYIRRPTQVNSETTPTPLNFNENPLFTGPDGEWEPSATPLVGEQEQTPERSSSSPLGELPTPSNRQKAPSTAERASIDQPLTIDNLYQKTKAAEKINQSPLQNLYARSRREKPNDNFNAPIAAPTVPFIATSGVLTSQAIKAEKLNSYEIVKVNITYSDTEIKMLAQDKLKASDVVFILRSDTSFYLDDKRTERNPNWDMAQRVEVFFKGNPSEAAQTSAAKVALALLKDELGLSDEELISKIQMEILS